MVRYAEIEVRDSDCETLERVRDMLKEVPRAGGGARACFAGATSDLSAVYAQGHRWYTACQLDSTSQVRVVLDILELEGYTVPKVIDSTATIVYIGPNAPPGGKG